MNKNLSTFIIIGVVTFVVGAGLGIFYQSQIDAPQLANFTAIKAVFKNLSSKAVPSILAYGQVTNIEGRNLTLSYSGDSVSIAISDSANINSFVKDSNGVPSQQKIDFSQIKNGDTLNISVKILPNGQLEGQSVIILSSAH